MERGPGEDPLTAEPSGPSEIPAAAEPGEPGEPGERCLVFSLGGLLLAVPSARLRELAEAPRAPRLARLPLVPAWVRGVANLRGDVLAVVDLLPFLGGGELPERPANRLLVLGPAAGEAWAGLLVEKVHGMAVAPVSPEVPKELPGEHPLGEFLLGSFRHAQGEAAVLDVDRLLARLAEETQRRG